MVQSANLQEIDTDSGRYLQDAHALHFSAELFVVLYRHHQHYSPLLLELAAAAALGQLARVQCTMHEQVQTMPPTRARHGRVAAYDIAFSGNRSRQMAGRKHCLRKLWQCIAGMTKQAAKMASLITTNGLSLSEVISRGGKRIRTNSGQAYVLSLKIRINVSIHD
jgi:hypothetical protein